MLPGSVVARAKMKITAGQSDEEPRSRSLDVLESWRASTSTSAGTVAGAAEARLAAKVRTLRSFIMDVAALYVYS